MKRFLVVFLASLFVMLVMYHYFPSIAEVAFTVPSHRFGSGSIIGGFGITWTIILFLGCLVGLSRLAKK